MNQHSSSSHNHAMGDLVEASSRVCRRASGMRCTHEACAKRHGKNNQILFGAVVIMNAAAAFLLAGALREMLPRLISIAAGLLSAVAAICTGLALTFDYKGKAARHSELSTCYAALVLSCQADTDRFKAGRLSAPQFDTILGCNVRILQELELRSHGLDSSCTSKIEAPPDKPLQPASDVPAVA